MIDSHAVSDRLERLAEYSRYLKEYQKVSIEQFKKDFTLQGAVCRYFQLSVEVCIDIAELIISSLRLRKPMTGFEAVEILAENKIIPTEFAKKFAPVVSFRNILVHDYLKIDMDKVYIHLQDDLSDFNEYAKYISNFLREKKL